jgi:hypothetical protein
MLSLQSNRAEKANVFLLAEVDLFLFQISGNWFCCDTCQQYYPSKFVLEKHKMSTHANVVRTTDRLQCDFCPKQLISTYVSAHFVTVSWAVPDTNQA